MQSKTSCVGLAVLALVTACARNDGSAPSHPIVGKWQHIAPQTNCTEVYTFRADGTRAFTSGRESGESVYKASATPSRSGFYKVEDTIVSTNGGVDCFGGGAPVGDRATAFIRFVEDGNAFMICNSESGEVCGGPFRKVSMGLLKPRTSTP